MYTSQNQLKQTSNRLGWTLVIMIGVMYAAAFLNSFVLVFLEYLVLGNAITANISIACGAVADTFFYLTYFIVPVILFYVISRKKKTQPIKFQVKFSKYLPLMIFSGLAVTQIAAVLNAWFCQAIHFELPTDEYVQYMTNPEMVAMYMTVSLAPAFAEELLFRGVIYTNLRPYGKTLAVFASAVCFSLMHQNIAQTFYTMVAGIVLALIYEATGSIWGSIFLHMFNNLYSVLQSAILYRYSETTAMVLLNLANALIILVGGISTIYLLMLEKKKAKETSQAKELGVFNISQDIAETTHETTASIPTGKAFLTVAQTPGMLVFGILSVTLMVLTYFGILLLNILGGLAG